MHSFGKVQTLGAILTMGALTVLLADATFSGSGARPKIDVVPGTRSASGAQGATSTRTSRHRHLYRVRYILEDVGTLGGPSSGMPELEQILLNGGILAGQADTSAPDPYAPNCFVASCFVDHTFAWNGTLHDLGSLPGNLGSVPSWIDAQGAITGTSQTGVVDPLSNVPEWRAVLWTNGRRLDLGTLGGNESAGIGMNDSTQVTGVATNATPDPYGLLFPGESNRAFLWRHGKIRDLGTLGGPDSFGQYINNRGQVAGFSYINNVPGPNGIPTVDPFLWDPEGRKMFDVGGFGGTFGQVNSLNDRGQVIGTSNGAGDTTTYAFVWYKGTLTKLEALGGSYTQPNWINAAGEIAGFAFHADNLTSSPVLWRNGRATPLAKLPGYRCGGASYINSVGQIIGELVAMPGFCSQPDPSETAQAAVLWENGSVVDLNTVIPANSPLQLVKANDIDGRGEIAGIGVPPGVPVYEYPTKGHAFVLIPCEERPYARGCGEMRSATQPPDDAQAPADAARPNQARSAARIVPLRGLAAIRAFIAHRYRLRGPVVPIP
jgi:probable HAF family extracellular repeat protein